MNIDSEQTTHAVAADFLEAGVTRGDDARDGAGVLAPELALEDDARVPYYARVVPLLRAAGRVNV